MPAPQVSEADGDEGWKEVGGRKTRTSTGSGRAAPAGQLATAEVVPRSSNSFEVLETDESIIDTAVAADPKEGDGNPSLGT